MTTPSTTPPPPTERQLRYMEALRVHREALVAEQLKHRELIELQAATLKAEESVKLEQHHVLSELHALAHGHEVLPLGNSCPLTGSCEGAIPHPAHSSEYEEAFRRG